jgi:hypothetical protein
MMIAIFYNGQYVTAWHPDPENMGPTSLTYDLVEQVPEILARLPDGYAVKRVSAGVYELYELPKPEPTSADKIVTLENEAALLVLELVDTQTRLQQSETDHATLLLELVDKGVI